MIMKAIWRGGDEPILGLIYGKEYEILATDFDDLIFGVVDEAGDSYLYPAEDFEIIEGGVDEFPDKRKISCNVEQAVKQRGLKNLGK